MRVTVVGAGAMGGIVGAGLARGGVDTLLLDVDRDLVGRIRERGLSVDRCEGETTTKIDARSDTDGLEPADIVCFCVKSFHTAAAAELAAGLVDEDTVVASLQNGWGNGELLAERFGAERCVLGVTYNSGTVLAPGRVAHTGVGPTLVGSYDGDGDDRARKVRDALRDGGFEAEVETEVRSAIWSKLILNAATLPTAALTGMSAGQLYDSEPMRALVHTLAREAVAVARAQGYEIDPDERVETIDATCQRVGEGKASMLQDVEAGRRTEVHVINGAVVRAAQDHQLPAPANAAMHALIQGLESARGQR